MIQFCNNVAAMVSCLHPLFKAGTYNVRVTLSGQNILDSPFTLIARPGVQLQLDRGREHSPELLRAHVVPLVDKIGRLECFGPRDFMCGA
eukprot:624546-Amphidinium_carterae.1